jgi:hypothetical protein
LDFLLTYSFIDFDDASKATLTMTADPNATSSNQMVVTSTAYGAINVSGSNNVLATSIGAECDLPFANGFTGQSAYNSFEEYAASSGDVQAQHISEVELGAVHTGSGDMDFSDANFELPDHDFFFTGDFEPEERAAGLGVFFDPNAGDKFESLNMNSFVDTKTIWEA